MRKLVLASLAIALASCTTTTVTPSPPYPSPAAVNPSPTSHVLRPGADIVTDRIGDVTISHPRAWSFVPGPPSITGTATGYAVPLFYLSTTTLDVVPCPTPDPTTHVFVGCPNPLRRLPEGGVFVAVTPNLGLPAFVPPAVSVRPATDTCLAMDGEAEVDGVVGAVVVSACLRRPRLAVSEAEVRSMIDSMTGAPDTSATSERASTAPLAAGEQPLPTSVPHACPTGAVCDVCTGVGIDATLHGAASDPARTWILTGNGKRYDAVWLNGYRARFAPSLEVFDANDHLVAREGTPVGNICGGGGSPNTVLLTPDLSGNF